LPILNTMASLVKVTKESRIFLKYGGVALGVFFVIYMIIKGGSLVQTVFFPKPPPPPTEALGKLPRLTFPAGGTPGIQFKISTINGFLPKFPDRLNVYTIIQQEPDLLALENTRRALANSDFTEGQIKLSDTLYQWTQFRTGVIMQYDILSKDFTLTSNYLNDPSFASNSTMPDENRVKGDVIDFVSSISKKSSNIDREKTKVEYLVLENGSLIPADNLIKAKYAKVTLYQSDVDEIPMIYDAPDESILSFVVSYPARGFQVLEGIYYNHEPNLDETSDYPIKTAAQALEELKLGNGYMINPSNLTTVDITDVELRYYLTKNNIGFLMPVIVFTGINFYAYVEAIPTTSLAN